MADLKIYSIDEVKDLHRVTRRTVYSYIKDGKLHATKIGKYWRVTEKNLEDFLNNGTQERE